MTEIKYLTHREAAQARLKGETLMFKGCTVESPRLNLSDHFLDEQSPYYRAPRVFTHPGGTCPAPETEAPEVGGQYWHPYFTNKQNAAVSIWEDGSYDKRLLSRGLVYLTREAAIARAELMLAGVVE